MKILVNSYPRSGTTTFVNAIRLACLGKISDFGDEFFHKENWVAKSHIPIIFLGNYENILISTVIRKPSDAITSNCFRWSNGYTGNIVNGKIVVDKSREIKENKFDDTLINLIDHQILQYESYYECLKNGNSNVKIFTYEQTQNDIVSSINKIMLLSGSDIKNLNYEPAINIVKNPPQPTKEKTNLYYQIKEYIENSSNFLKCNELYNFALQRSIF